MSKEIYQIKLPQFEGPFDLLLFFIERDELDIYNIPITKITNDFFGVYTQQRIVEHRTEQRVYFVHKHPHAYKSKNAVAPKRTGSAGK